jgi:hypothetical protein
MKPSQGARETRKGLPLILGGVLSVALHSLFIVPAMISVMTARADIGAMKAEFEPDAVQSSEPEPDTQELQDDEQPRLGIDNGTPSTLTWIGYDEYQEHVAAFADVEQAAFTDDPAGGGAPASTIVTESTPTTPSAPTPEAVQQAREFLASMMEQLSERFDASPATTSSEAVLLPSDEMELLPIANAEALVKIIESDVDAPQQADASKHEVAQESTTEQVAANPPNETTPTQNAPPAARPSVPDSAQPTMGPAGISGPAVGESSDKDSAPTSTIDVPLDQIKIGKPFAAKGLEVKPQRPEFTILQRLTAAGGNPLAEIHFARDGKPRVPTRLIEGTGNATLDEAIAASLFRWRATGKELAALEGEQTVPIRIRILLHARRR